MTYMRTHMARPMPVKRYVSLQTNNNDFLIMNKYLIALFFLTSILLINNNSIGQVPDNKLIITDTISSKILNRDRVIDIYLPANYFNTNDTYPIQVIIGHKQRSEMSVSYTHLRAHET